jgi:hypothetical protein
MIQLPSQRGAVLVLIITAIIIVGIVVLLWLGLRNATKIKAFASDFPTQGGSVIVSLTLIFFTGLVIVVRLALGLKFPDGYEMWIGALVALAGVTTTGMIMKRKTDYGYVERKNAGPSPVTVQAPSTVTVENSDSEAAG